MEYEPKGTFYEKSLNFINKPSEVALTKINDERVMKSLQFTDVIFC